MWCAKQQRNAYTHFTRQREKVYLTVFFCIEVFNFREVYVHQKNKSLLVYHRRSGNIVTKVKVQVEKTEKD